MGVIPVLLMGHLKSMDVVYSWIGPVSLRQLELEFRFGVRRGHSSGLRVDVPFTAIRSLYERRAEDETIG